MHMLCVEDSMEFEIYYTIKEIALAEDGIEDVTLFSADNTSNQTK